MAQKERYKYGKIVDLENYESDFNRQMTDCIARLALW
jgi:hypothetical protein